jgi:ADP-dependent NAD(P)H-hydrate dehydratase / NAD(P)H-hydrate epimerase
MLQDNDARRTLPARLYTAAETRRLDRCAIEKHQIPGIVLMKRAGRAVFDTMRAHWPSQRRLTVVCGKGNNAGDGYIVAGIAAERGCDVQLIQLGDPAALRGDAAHARDWALSRGLIIRVADETAPKLGPFDGVLIVDALLGTGVRGNVRAGYAAAIEQVNGSGLPVISIDLPSGVCPDRGVVLGSAVKASLTVTLIGAKRGLFTGAGVEHAGAVHYETLGVPAAVLTTEAGIPALQWRSLQSQLPGRGANAHKGLFGHVLVVGGEQGMGGAVAMAAESALRSGAGMVSVATRPEHVAAVLARCPEVMARGLEQPSALPEMLSKATLIAVGPGLGRTSWSAAVLQEVLAALEVRGGRPLVVDADALNLAAASGIALPENCIITPHPGEAARLLGRSATAVQADRFDAALALAARDRSLAVLKGAGTIVAAERLLGVCLDGNASMATAGAGDVLTGIVAGLWAQRLERDLVGTMAVCLHGAAGDLAVARHGPRGLTATDLLHSLRDALNGGA